MFLPSITIALVLLPDIFISPVWKVVHNIINNYIQYKTY
jgi:hypothetical protein